MIIDTQETCTEKLVGSEFEDFVVDRCDKLRGRRIAAIGKYGVKVRFDAAVNAYRPIRSLPDFEGVFGPHATQTIFDCKVESSASFGLSEYRIQDMKPKALQLKHMYNRSDFGAVCFFLIHFNGRELKSKTVEPVTFAMPVHRDHAFWIRFEQRDEKSLGMTQLEEYAIKVPWTKWENERSFRPDVMMAIHGVQGLSGLGKSVSAPRRLNVRSF